jgi:hypothetical protein
MICTALYSWAVHSGTAAHNMVTAAHSLQAPGTRCKPLVPDLDYNSPKDHVI